VALAVDRLARTGDLERGAVFTRSEVVEAILDLAGYRVEHDLAMRRVLEPSFGAGDFLLPVVDRLLESYRIHGGMTDRANVELVDCVRAVEVHRESYARTRIALASRLTVWGLSSADAEALCARWLVCDDFLLCNLDGSFDAVVGNPPYVRQERIPAALLAEYRRRFRTLYDRADLYIPFFERGLDLLAPSGRLGYICANRWLKNRYGGPLRDKILAGFRLTHFIDMESTGAFQSDVIAYPAITVIERGVSIDAPTRVALAQPEVGSDLPTMVRAMCSPQPVPGLTEDLAFDGRGDAPWLLDDVPRLKVLRRIEAALPLLEEAGCKVGIGVATGCDRVFIADYAALPVEDERKLPLVMARDLVDGGIRWQGKGVLNPFLPDGRLAALDTFPRFGAYLAQHHAAVAGRHVAARSAAAWYRTIDRIYPDLVRQPKLLVPDIKGEAVFALDEGRYYPHHNLYFITASDWDLRALQTILRSSITLMTVATYCTRMSGGFLRFQAQYLRRIRLPRWRDVPQPLRRALADSATLRDQAELDAPVFEVYGLAADEIATVQRVASAARVTGPSRAAA
jgi:hypothetical protein